jgi:ATP-dependent Clp protease ATP-binding subunit ClpC
MKRLSRLYSKRLDEANDDIEDNDGVGAETQNQPDGEMVWPSLGVDLTEQARQGRIDPVIGRDKELDQVLVILARKTKDNPVLIGEPGVGKTAVVEKLALLMAGPNCPGFLKGTTLLEVNLNAIIPSPAWNKFVEEIEEQPLILFMDELHSLNKKFYDVLKPLLARRRLHLIGASTLKEYRNSIEQDGAMERRFQKVMVNEPSYEECMEIMRGIQDKYEQFHNVKYTEDALESFYKLSKRYITDRFLPDKAIDLMDETGAKIRKSAGASSKALSLEEERQDVLRKRESASKKGDYDLAAELDDRKKEIESRLTQMTKSGDMGERQEITKDMVEELVAKKTGIPVQSMKKSDKSSLKTLSSRLKAKVIGQDDAIDTVVKTVKRNRAGMKDPNRPEGVFLFVGPTGTGKTYLVKKLAESLFGSEDAIIRFDMAEFSEGHAGAKFIGSPPGYVGYGQGGQLTEKVRRKPYSIILLDEIEKASKEVLQSLLGVFEDGIMTDGEGNRVDFKNTVIIMTSNAGIQTQSEKKAVERKPMGFTVSKEEAQAEEKFKEITKEKILQGLKDEKKFSPEFLNRIDDIVIFQPISEEAIKSIANLELDKVADRLKDNQEIELIWGNSVFKLLVKHGFDPSMGARPMKRAIRKYIEDPIASYLIEDDVEEGAKVKVDYDVSKDELVINGKHISEILKESRARFVQKRFALFESKFSRRLASFSEFRSARINEAQPARQPEREEEEEETPYTPPVPSRPKRDPKPTPAPDPGPEPQPKPNPRPSTIPAIKPPVWPQGPVAKRKKPNEIDVVQRYLKELRMRKNKK